MESIAEGFRKCSDISCPYPLQAESLFIKGSNRCPLCRKRASADAQLRYRQRNKEKLLARAAACRASLTPEDKERIRAKARRRYWDNAEKFRAKARNHASKNRRLMVDRALAWKAKNLEKCRARDRAWHRNNKDRDREHRKLWQAKNPLKALQYRHKRRGKRFRLDTVFTAAQFQRMCDYYGNKCLCCDRTDVKLTADHVIPLSRGGLNDLANMQPICLACNSAKGNRWIKDYRPDCGAAFAPKQVSLFA